METYKISYPNDYGSDEDYKEMVRCLFPDLFPPEGDALDEEGHTENEKVELDEADLCQAFFRKLYACWPGLGELITPMDFGGIYEASTPPPKVLPGWYYISKGEED